MIIEENAIIDIWYDLYEIYSDHGAEYNNIISAHISLSICGDIYTEISHYVGIQIRYIRDNFEN